MSLSEYISKEASRLASSLPPLSEVQERLAASLPPISEMLRVQKSEVPPTTWQLLVQPPLPPLLAPLPGLFRLVAVLILAPIVLIGMLDFTWYAVFRTLGLERRRVRIPAPTSGRPAAIPLPTAKDFPSLDNTVASSPGSTRAPLLSPGAYDADTLLRHRARSASLASADADMEWLRTGGSFARVSTVRAQAAASASGSSTPVSQEASLWPPESPRGSVLRPTWARAKDIGVDGPMGYFDTDGEESGIESGRNSPVASFGRAQGGRVKRGFGSGKLGFTPVTPPVHTRPLPGGNGVGALDISGVSASSRNGSGGSSGNGAESFVEIDQLEVAIAAASAADLEPELQ